MKTLIATLGVALLSTTCVYAADLAPQPVEPEAPILAPFSWTGFYVGADAGYAWGKSKWRNNWSSAEPLGPNQQYFDYDPDGAVLGGHVGYNYQFDGGFVVGAEIDAAGSWMKGDNVELQDPNGTINPAYSGNSKVQFQGSGRLRLGYAYDRFLPYITGGVAVAHYKYGWDNNFPDSYSDSDTRVGWTVGAGLEYAITDNWLVRAQYLYSDYGDDDHGDYHGSRGKIGDGYARYNIDLKTHTATIGISYKF